MPPATRSSASQSTAHSAWPDTIQVQRPGKPITYADMNGSAPEATGTKKHPNHRVPPTWSAFYNADQGALPDVDQWKKVYESPRLAVYLAPGADWSHYARVLPGLTRFTGIEASLTPKEIDHSADYLQLQIEKRLPKVKLGTPATATGTLRVDVNLLGAHPDHEGSLSSLAAGLTGSHADRVATLVTFATNLAPVPLDRASLTAWVWDDATHAPVACLQMRTRDEIFEVPLSASDMARLRSALRREANFLAEDLSDLQHHLTVVSQAAIK